MIWWVEGGILDRDSNFMSQVGEGDTRWRRGALTLGIDRKCGRRRMAAAAMMEEEEEAAPSFLNFNKVNVKKGIRKESHSEYIFFRHEDLQRALWRRVA